jgi:hypothetical protein
MIEWITAHPALAASILTPLIGLAVDMVMGLIPDSWLKYVGGFRWAVGKIVEVLKTMPQTGQVKAALWVLEKVQAAFSK